MEKAYYDEKNGLYLLMDTELFGIKYVLASETDPEGDEDEENEVFILKEVSEDEDTIVYEPVEDEEELSSVLKIFEELLDEEGVALS